MTHHLDSFWAPSFALDVITKIGSFYVCLPFGGKCALYRQMIEIKMQRLSVLIAKTVDHKKDLKQKLVFVAALEQCQAKHIAMLWKVKKSNAAIKKEVTVYKIVLNTSMHEDNEHEEMLGILGPSKNKDVLSRGGAATPISNHILIDKDDLDLDAERHTYETVLIIFSHN